MLLDAVSGQFSGALVDHVDGQRGRLSFRWPPELGFDRHRQPRLEAHRGGLALPHITGTAAWPGLSTQANGATRPSLMPPWPRLCYSCWPTFGLEPCHRVCRPGRVAVASSVLRVTALEAGRAREIDWLDVGSRFRPAWTAELVPLTPRMERTSGNPEVMIGLIDGPVAMTHPDLAGARIREVPARLAGTCARPPPPSPARF